MNLVTLLYWGLVKKYRGGWAGAWGKVKVQKLMTHPRSWV